MGICAEAPRWERGLQSAGSWEDDGEARLRARHRLTTSRTFACGLKSALTGCPESAEPPFFAAATKGGPWESGENPSTPGKGVWLAGELFILYQLSVWISTKNSCVVFLAMTVSLSNTGLSQL